MRDQDKLIAVMPAYNEEDSIEEVVTSWYSVLESVTECPVLVVNTSGSRDGTEAILEKMKAHMPGLSYIRNSRNTYGDKVLDLYEKALLEKPDYVFQTDSDGQTDPGEFPDFWEIRKEYDAVIGSRTQRGDGKFRFLIEKTVCLLIFILCGVRLPDANTPFRVMKAEHLKDCMEHIPRDYSMPNIMLSIYGKAKGRVIFKSITFRPRTGGKNSMNYRKIFRTGVESIGAFLNFKKEILAICPKK